MMFTTYDRDNDPWTHGNAAYKNNTAIHNGGGFWYSAWSLCNINSVRGGGNDFRWYTAQTGFLYLESIRMWLTC